MIFGKDNRSIRGDIRSRDIHKTHSPSLIPPNLNPKLIPCKAWNVSAFPGA